MTRSKQAFVLRGSVMALALALVGCDSESPSVPEPEPEPEPEPSLYENVEELGEALFSDTNLSRHRTQSCATCHDSEHAFTDGRLDDDGLVGAVSLGDDNTSWGDRNAPTLTYASLTPDFHIGTRKRHNKQNNHRTYEGPLGGQFHDGRETDLEGQAGGPPLNPVEMGMLDKTAVADRILENEAYSRAFIQFFGDDALDSDDDIYAAMTESIATYERTELFTPFDSRYDRSLRGEVTLTFMELTGKSVFFSQFANCGICHQLYSEGDPINETLETFTGYEYHNIGVPANEAVRQHNGTIGTDDGLLDNPNITDLDARGKFKTPTLRNIAVTGPYMHNGVFRELRTVIEFYDQFNNADDRPVNPETGELWREPEVPDTVAYELLEVSDPLTDIEVEGLVCFLRALTDQRYEHLIEPNGIDCGI